MTRTIRLTFGAVAALSIFATAVPVAGQAIDARVLQQVQGQLGQGSSGLDRARDATDSRDATARSVQPGVRIDTPEEQELRRAEARAGLQRLYRPSPVEREFRERLADPTLRQFGYELFQVAQGSGGGLTGAVSDSYTVGVGDDVVVQFQGATNDSKTVRVDREGRLVVGSLPPIAAAGRSLGAITRDVQAATRRTLLGTEVYVSLGSVRTVTVFVGGEVDPEKLEQTPALFTATTGALVISAIILALLAIPIRKMMAGVKQDVGK